MDFIRFNDINIAVYFQKAKVKKRPPIVLIHGYTGSAYHHFKYEIENYSKKFETDVIAFDHRGHGNSEPGNYKDLPIDTHYTDFVSLMNHFEFQEIILIGASFGGFIASRFALDYPNKVKNLIIISSTGESSPGMKNTLISINKTINAFITSNYNIRSLDPKSMKFLSVLLKIHFEKPPYNKLLFLQTFIQKFIPNNWSLLSEIKERVTCPVLILHGDLDYVELENARNLHNSFQNSELIIIPKYGHLPQRKNPQLVEKYIANFLLN